MTARWIDGALEIKPENVMERDALLTIWKLKKDYCRPIDPDDFGVRADGVSDDTAAIQAVLDATVSL